MNTSIIFDLDGTLWDATKQIALVWQSIAKKYNMRVNLQTIKKIMGLTTDEIVSSLFPKNNSAGYSFIEDCQKNENCYLALYGRKYISEYY